MGVRERGCGICRERKLLCDRARPSCSRCQKAGRVCDGYGLRLSWPRQNDKRRSIVASVRRKPITSNLPTETRFVNASSWDLGLHYMTAAEGFWEASSVARKPWYSVLAVEDTLRWVPFKLNSDDSNLVQYFESVAASSLAMMGENIAPLLNTLLRMALSTNTLSSAGLLHSILAFASLIRYGPHNQAMQHQAAALKLMRKASFQQMGQLEACQHVAVAMLLSTYEFRLAKHSYSHTASYVCNAKNLVKAVSSNADRKDNDFVVLLGWMHYQYALGCFTILHWPYHDVPMSETSPPGFKLRTTLNALCGSKGIPYPAGASHHVLHLLLETLQNIRDPLDPEFATDKYRSLIKSLRTELENTRFDVEETDPSMQDEDSSTIAQLYQLAALIYLERASTNMMGPESETINRWSDRAFELLDQTNKCNWPFLFLILGAEARTDQRRQRLLDLVSEAEKLPIARRFESAKRMVEFVWVQDDLGTQAVNYVGKMNTAFSACTVVPSFL